MYRKYHEDGTLPKNGEVFVFGSNLAGIHGAGAAKVAQEKFGAIYGRGVGPQNDHRSYAIPTKGLDLRFALTLDQIKKYVDEFVKYTQDLHAIAHINHPGFFVTRVGCGFAGYSDAEIATLFKNAQNCSFAEQWKPYLEEVATVKILDNYTEESDQILKLASVVDESLQKHPEKIDITPEYIEGLMKGRL